ncbi:MAG: lipopolysaccharide biosynthesis protein [Flavobacteriales bacterium]
MFKNILKSEFSRNVMTLLTGSAFAQLIPLLLMPVISRLFSPEEFGLFAFYFSLVSFFLVISSGRYEMAILLPKKDKDAINVLALAFSILVGVSLILLLALLFFEKNIQEIIDKPELNDWLLLIPLCVFVTSGHKIFTYWSNRKKRFKNTSLSIVTQSTSRSAVLFFGGLMKNDFFTGTETKTGFFKAIFKKDFVVSSGITPLGIGSFILSYVIGFSLSFFYLLVGFLRNDRELLKEIKKDRIKFLAKKHEKFPKINSLHALADELKNSGVTFVISYLFNDVILGFYSMTFRVLRAPLSVIGNSFSQVFLQKAAEMHAHNQDFVPLIKKTVKKLALIALPIFIPIVFFGPQLFSFVLGDKWEIAGQYAQYLTPWLFLNFAISPILQVALVLDKQKEIFGFALVGNLIIFISIFIGGYFFNDIIKGFILLSILQLFYYFFVYKWVLKISQPMSRKPDSQNHPI